MAINDNVLLFLSAVASVFRAGALSALGSILQSAAIAAAHTRAVDCVRRQDSWEVGGCGQEGRTAWGLVIRLAGA